MLGIIEIQTNAWPRVIRRPRYGTLATRIESTNKVMAPRKSHGRVSPLIGLARDSAMSNRYKKIGYSQTSKKYRQCNWPAVHNFIMRVDCLPSMLLR